MKQTDLEHKRRLYRYTFGAQYGKVLREAMAERGLIVEQQEWYNAIHHGYGKRADEIQEMCQQIYRQAKVMAGMK